MPTSSQSRPGPSPDPIPPSHSSGIFNDAALAALIDQGGIHLAPDAEPLEADQRQPASLDLRLSNTAYRVRASFLPGAGMSVADRLNDPRIAMHRLDLSRSAVLETHCVYVVPLMEALALDPDISALANPKSSTGRIDVFTRIITDNGAAFDHIPAGYTGPLYAEISPRTFPILVRPGDRLCQLRLRRGPVPAPLRTQTVSVDLSHDLSNGIAGYRARRHAGVIDLARIHQHDPSDYWEPVSARGGSLVLDPGEFYILASKEPVLIETDVAAEMAPIAPEIGEFRAHYAGFFDPGFGLEATGGAGGRAVLEVRGRDVPFILEHGQPAAKLVFEPMLAAPERPYGAVNSNYQGQGLQLSKHFAPWPQTVPRV